jgi:hypothetical protein
MRFKHRQGADKRQTMQMFEIRGARFLLFSQDDLPRFFAFSDGLPH